MKHKWLMRAGIVAGAIILFNVWTIAIFALMHHEPWVGRNFKNMPIDTYGQVIVLLFVTAWTPFLLIKYRRWWL